MMQQATAKLKFLHIAPRKTRFIADVVRGLPVNEAEAQLMLMARRPAEPLLKLLRSAVASAKNDLKLSPETLYIKEIRVDGGPTMKRWMPRARGSAGLIRKRMSHVTIVLAQGIGQQKQRFVIPAPEKKKAPEKKEQRKDARRKIREAEKPARAERDQYEHQEREEQKGRSKDSPQSKKGFLKQMFRRKSV